MVNKYRIHCLKLQRVGVGPGDMEQPPLRTAGFICLVASTREDSSYRRLYTKWRMAINSFEVLYASC